MDFEVFLLGIFYGGENEEFADTALLDVRNGVGDGHDGVADFVGDITHFALFFHGVDGALGSKVFYGEHRVMNLIGFDGGKVTFFSDEESARDEEK